MAERTLQWGGRRCVYCSVSTLRRLTHADVLPLNRRALFPKGNLQWRTTVLTHYYGPIEYLHVPLFCSGCQTLYFHNFVVPGPLLHNEVRMELAGDPSQYLCLQTGFSEVAFGIDLVRYYESLQASNGLSYLGFMRGYAAFWQTMQWSTDWTVYHFTRPHLLFALIDFLALSGASACMFNFAQLCLSSSSFKHFAHPCFAQACHTSMGTVLHRLLAPLCCKYIGAMLPPLNRSWNCGNPNGVGASNTELSVGYPDVRIA